MIEVKDATKRKNHLNLGAQIFGVYIGNSLHHLEDKILGRKQNEPNREKQAEDEAHHCCSKGGQFLCENTGPLRALSPEALRVKTAELSHRALSFWTNESQY